MFKAKNEEGKIEGKGKALILSIYCRHFFDWCEIYKFC